MGASPPTSSPGKPQLIAQAVSPISFIERAGQALATVPEQGENPVGRPLFQNLQYSKKPAPPLGPMGFNDPAAPRPEASLPGGRGEPGRVKIEVRRERNFRSKGTPCLRVSLYSQRRPTGPSSPTGSGTRGGGQIYSACTFSAPRPRCSAASVRAEDRLARNNHPRNAPA